MYSSYLQEKLGRLLSQLVKYEKLLERINYALDTERDPKLVLRYSDDKDEISQRIEEIKQEKAEVEQELAASQEESNTSNNLQQKLGDKLKEVSGQIEAIDRKTTQLMGGQVVLHQNLTRLRKEIINHYNASEQQIIFEVTHHFDNSQEKAMENLLEAIENRQLTEEEMSFMLASLDNYLDKNPVALPPSQAEVVDLVKQDSLEVRHRLKLAIPFLLGMYEIELELENDPRKIFQQLVSKLQN